MSVEELKGRIAKLEEKVEKLEAENAKLKGYLSGSQASFSPMWADYDGVLNDKIKKIVASLMADGGGGAPPPPSGSSLSAALTTITTYKSSPPPSAPPPMPPQFDRAAAKVERKASAPPDLKSSRASVLQEIRTRVPMTPSFERKLAFILLCTKLQLYC